MKIPCLALLFLCAGCASSVYDDRDALLAAPINCDTAEVDIAEIEAALPTRRERARSVVQSVTPVGAATGVVSGTYDERASVLTGRTEKELVARIDQIESECGIAESDPAQATEEEPE